MLGSTIPIAILGAKFAMSVEPFWTPTVSAPGIISLLTIIICLVPIVGMFCGVTIPGIVVAVSYNLKEFQESKDKFEVCLAFGATDLWQSKQ